MIIYRNYWNDYSTLLHQFSIEQFWCRWNNRWHYSIMALFFCYRLRIWLGDHNSGFHQKIFLTPKTLGCEERKTGFQPTEDILTNKNRDNQLRKAHVVKQLGIDIQWQLGGLPQEEANRGRELVMGSIECLYWIHVRIHLQYDSAWQAMHVYLCVYIYIHMYVEDLYEQLQFGLGVYELAWLMTHCSFTFKTIRKLSNNKKQHFMVNFTYGYCCFVSPLVPFGSFTLQPKMIVANETIYYPLVN